MLSGSLAELVAAGRIAPDWGEALAAAGAVDDALGRVRAFLAEEARAGATVLPDEALVFRAFERPLSDARVLIVGQDPYPTPGHAIGLSFATARGVRPLPRSLSNIFRELDDDLGQALGADPESVGTSPDSDAAGTSPGTHTDSWADDFWAVPQAPPPPRHGDLSAWADSGVLLLNRVLTVRAGQAGSHRGSGWEEFTELAIRALVARGGPLVAILWGNDARKLAPLLGDTPIIESAHPSPLSASRGFFGSGPFSRANEALAALGSAPIDWRAASI